MHNNLTGSKWFFFVLALKLSYMKSFLPSIGKKDHKKGRYSLLLLYYNYYYQVRHNLRDERVLDRFFILQRHRNNTRLVRVFQKKFSFPILSFFIVNNMEKYSHKKNQLKMLIEVKLLTSIGEIMSIGTPKTP